jgi:hypothetical protein
MGLFARALIVVKTAPTLAPQVKQIILEELEFI